MKVVADENIPLVREAFADFGTVDLVHGRQITREKLDDVSVLLVRSISTVDQKLLEGTNVKFVASATIGTDHIDQNYLREKCIGFAYAPGSNADSVAEYIAAALCQISHKLNRPLSDMTLGIVGVGNVGSRVCVRAGGLNMKYLLNDPPKKRLTGDEAYLPLETVLAQSDIVTVHVPLITEGEDATYHLIESTFLSKMKDGAVLINSSRGKVVDEQALRAQRSRLGACVLDVWENEPSISTETLKIADLATPHIAGYSYDGKIRGTQMIYDAACAFFFREKKWQIGADFFKEPSGIIDVTESDDPVSDAIEKAYPIKEDDARLRKLLEKPREKQGQYFDDLRKNYPRRMEFPHFTVLCTRKQQGASKTLKELGFPVEIR